MRTRRFPWEELVASGKLVEEGEFVRFTDEVLFGTPSQAGSMINGTSCNGRIPWKRVGDGKTLNDLEAEAGEVVSMPLQP